MSISRSRTRKPFLACDIKAHFYRLFFLMFPERRKYADMGCHRGISRI